MFRELEKFIGNILKSLSFIIFHFVILPSLLVVILFTTSIKGFIGDNYLPKTLQDKQKVEKVVPKKVIVRMDMQ